jgi:hypothetical protein
MQGKELSKNHGHTTVISPRKAATMAAFLFTSSNPKKNAYHLLAVGKLEITRTYQKCNSPIISMLLDECDHLL